MAIGVIFQEPITQSQYEQVKAQVAPDNQPPQGMLYHAAGPSENSFCVIEVWESQETAQAFFDEKLATALQAANVNAPQPTFFQVVNIMQP